MLFRSCQAANVLQTQSFSSSCVCILALKFRVTSSRGVQRIKVLDQCHRVRAENGSSFINIVIVKQNSQSVASMIVESQYAASFQSKLVQLKAHCTNNSDKVIEILG